MYRKILVGFKETEQGRDALELGQILARANGAEMRVATVASDDGARLARLARSEAADLLVLGSTHRGPIGRVIPGATIAQALGEAACAVAVAPPGFAAPASEDSGWRPLSGDLEDVGMRVVGVGYDASPAAHEALQVAADLAVHNGAALRVCTVARKYAHIPGDGAGGRAPGVPAEADVLRDCLHRAIADLPAEARALPVFLRGIPVTELLKVAAEGVDLLVLGSRSGGPLRRALHGSVSGAVMLEAPCPVLISPSGVRAPHAVPA
jgi:nucleotide-binding universal stress UspA family protein